MQPGPEYNIEILLLFLSEGEEGLSSEAMPIICLSAVVMAEWTPMSMRGVKARALNISLWKSGLRVHAHKHIDTHAEGCRVLLTHRQDGVPDTHSHVREALIFTCPIHLIKLTIAPLDIFNLLSGISLK